MPLYTPHVDAIAEYIRRGPSAKARHPDIVARFAVLLGELRRTKPREPEGDPAWSFWVRSERGPISAFGDYQEFLDAGEVASLAEFESRWHEYYPSPTKWHEVTVVCFQRRVFVGVDPDCRFEVDLEAQSVEGADVRNGDVESFVVWLLDQLESEVRALLADPIGYTERIGRELPLEHRYGRIERRVLWEQVPGIERLDEALGSAALARFEEALRDPPAAGRWGRCCGSVCRPPMNAAIWRDCGPCGT